MTLYVPGTDERDLKKVIMSLQQVAARTDAGRTLLTSNLTLYVRTDGSDSNDGTANTAAGAFLTLQAAYDKICSSYDTAGYTTIIQGTSGANSFGAGLEMTQAWAGAGEIIIDLGSGGSISGTGPCLKSIVNLPASVTIKNATLASSGNNCIYAAGGGSIYLGENVVFGACGGYHMVADSMSAIRAPVSYSISGNAVIHAYAKSFGYVDLYNGAYGTTLSITSNITMSTAFAYADPLGGITSISAARTISLGGHTVTGTRYNVLAGSTINTQGGGANYFPGTVAGTGAGTYL